LLVASAGVTLHVANICPTHVQYVEMKFMEIKITGKYQNLQARQRLGTLSLAWLRELEPPLDSQLKASRLQY